MLQVRNKGVPEQPKQVMVHSAEQLNKGTAPMESSWSENWDYVYL